MNARAIVIQVVNQYLIASCNESPGLVLLKLIILVLKGVCGGWGKGSCHCFATALSPIFREGFSF